MNRHFSIKREATDRLIKLFSLKNDEDDLMPENDEVSETPWKILVLDTHTKQILSPLFTPNQLHQHGVTLFVDIDSLRSPLPLTAGLYFLTPTNPNISFIQTDISSHLYDSCYLSFLYPTQSEFFPDLARAVASCTPTDYIKGVSEEPLDFLTYDHNFFSTRLTDTLFNLLRPDVDSGAKDNLLKQIASSLASVLLLLGIHPIFHSSPTEDSQSLTRHVTSFLQSSSSHRPKYQCDVFIFDRTTDFVAPLLHPWSYFGLINEVLQFSPARVCWTDKESKTHVENLNGDTDPFWSEHFRASFEAIGPAVKKCWDDYTAESESVKRSVQQDQTNDTAIKKLDSLTDTKENLDKHTLIAAEITNAIKTRQLDVLSTVSENIVRGTVNEDEVRQIAGLDESSDPSHPIHRADNADLVRMLSLLRLTVPMSSPTSALVSSLEQSLSALDIPSFSAYNYIKRNTTHSAPSPESTTSGRFSSFISKIAPGGQFRHQHQRILNDFVDNKQSAELRAFHVSSPPVHPPPPPSDTVVVFELGGGTVAEYLAFTAKDSRRKVIYGCSELLTASSFLDQLTRLENLKS
ncbi:putative SEC1 family transport protein SLY1 [Blattamonas nauphoetae]|uniref:SEC1 family transport protein SLY1 n=1 Tax=Blattamonas nauphoetae TaxID=2049346 RepID=A0ABQ9YBT5_9EUKA|nr:putative SEC1 family transport protein SLY1 [Blattamonas nauphoetae]